MEKLNKCAYTELIEQNIAWLDRNASRCLEKEHIIAVLRRSIDLEYLKSKKEEEEECYGRIFYKKCEEFGI